VIAARAALLLVAALLVLAATGGWSREVQPSLLRLEVTAVLALLAPLFWPGLAATPKRTALRIALWSVAVACAAGVMIRLLGHAGQTWAHIVPSCAMLALIVVLALTTAAVLEAQVRSVLGDTGTARDAAGCVVALALALLGSMPLWLGPVGELLSADHGGAIDAIVGSSPLTHLAVASGNDLLRNPWLYQHSNLAALQVSYPGLAGLLGCYVSVTLVLALAALAFRVPGRTVIDATLDRSTTEKASS
jgi:hypothetical protein